MHIKRVRHTITKSPLIRPSRAWLYHRGLNPSDIFVASYPRAGSTWLRFLIYELLMGETGSFEAVNETIPDIGRHHNAPGLLDGTRLIKTHDPYHKEYNFAIYLVRDVRDVVISEFYFQKLWQIFDGTFQDFLNAFLEGKVNHYGSWVNHTNSWLNAQESMRDDILLIRFDELRQDTHTTLTNILSFMGAVASSSQIEQAISNNTTAKMRKKESSFKNTAKNLNFVRKGKVGGWQEILTAEQIQQIEVKTGPTLRKLGYLTKRAHSPHTT